MLKEDYNTPEKIKYRNLCRDTHLQSCKDFKFCTNPLGHSSYEVVPDEEILNENVRFG